MEITGVVFAVVGAADWPDGCSANREARPWFGSVGRAKYQTRSDCFDFQKITTKAAGVDTVTVEAWTAEGA